MKKARFFGTITLALTIPSCTTSYTKDPRALTSLAVDHCVQQVRVSPTSESKQALRNLLFNAVYDPTTDLFYYWGDEHARLLFAGCMMEYGIPLDLVKKGEPEENSQQQRRF